MKHFSILSMALLFFTTQIKVIDYSKEIKKEFDETARIVVGKFEKNAYTLNNDFEKCSTSLTPSLCYKGVLADIEKEQTKNYQAIRNCFMAAIGIFVVKQAATGLSSLVLPENGSQTINRTIGATEIPVTVSFLTTGLDCVALWILESKVQEEMKKQG